MKNIITIDFDIIMAPSINLYNNLVPGMGWDDFKEFPQMQVLTADLTHYKILTNWLINIFPKINKENIHIIEDHGQIIKYLNPNEKVNIYNIDHHHDCGYKLLNEDIHKLKLNCGNWGLILQEKQLLNKFIWIRNKNSMYPPPEEKVVDFSDYILQDYNLNNLPVPDKLILCLSEPWTPPAFRPLFYLWLDFMNKYYHTSFNIDLERC